MKTTSIENKFIDFIDRHRNVLLLVFVGLIGLAIRWAGRYYASEDMTVCLIPWFEKIRAAGGLPALSAQVGDYGLLYQTLISLMTYLPMQAIVQYKLLSMFFDVALALFAGLIYRDVCLDRLAGATAGDREQQASQVRFRSCLVAVAVWLLPTVILNSSYWGQCDAMYASCCLGSLYLLRRGSFAWAFVLLGLAFGCKLQAVFILPIIGVYYMLSRRFSLLWVLLSVAVMWLSGIVAFAFGRDLLAPIMIYTGQVGHYQEMMAVGLWYCLCHKRYVLSREGYFAAAAWFMWSMLLFLPSMHDRYAYLLDILLLLVGCMDRRFIKYAVVTTLISLYYYGIYLFGDRGEGHILLALVYLLAYMHYTWTLVTGLQHEER